MNVVAVIVVYVVVDIIIIVSGVVVETVTYHNKAGYTAQDAPRKRAFHLRK